MEHVLAAELAERVRKKAPGLRVIVIRGRGAADKPEQALCAKAGLAEPVARAGLNVMTTLCRSKGEGQEEECEFAGGCLFLAQFRDTGPAIRISAHAAMFTPRNQLLPTPHLVVVDELFWRNAAVHSRLFARPLARGGPVALSAAQRRTEEENRGPHARGRRRRHSCPECTP